MESNNVGQPLKAYIYQLCAGTGCHLEDLPEAIADRVDGKWESRESVSVSKHKIYSIYGKDKDMFIRKNVSNFR